MKLDTCPSLCAIECITATSAILPLKHSILCVTFSDIAIFFFILAMWLSMCFINVTVNRVRLYVFRKYLPSNPWDRRIVFVNNCAFLLSEHFRLLDYTWYFKSKMRCCQIFFHCKQNNIESKNWVVTWKMARIILYKSTDTKRLTCRKKNKVVLMPILLKFFLYIKSLYWKRFSRIFQCKRGLRSGGGARATDRATRSRRHLLRVLQDNARMEICKYFTSFFKHKRLT